MRKARDGRLYDIDNMAWDANDDEIEIIQYLRPDGKRRRMVCTIGKELLKKADEIGLIISAKELTTRQVVIYVRRREEPTEDERLQIADNHVGENDPQKVLIRMIRKEIEKK